MIRRPPRSTRVRSSAASDVYKRQSRFRSISATGGVELEVVYEHVVVTGAGQGGPRNAGIINQTDEIARVAGARDRKGVALDRVIEGVVGGQNPRRIRRPPEEPEPAGGSGELNRQCT